MLKTLKKILDTEDKKNIVILIIFSIIVSIMEVFGITMLFPFIGLASNPKDIEKNRYLKNIYENFFQEDYKEFMLVLGVGIVGIFVLKNILAVAFNYYSTIISRKMNRKYSKKLFKNYLEFEYINYVRKNRSDFIRIITHECSIMVSIFQNIASLTSEVCVMLLLYSVMLYLNWKMTLAMTAFLSLNVLVIKYFIINKSEILGEVREEKHAALYKIVSSTFSNYKFIKLQGDQESIEKGYDETLKNRDELEIKQTILIPLPRTLLEFSGFFMIVSIIVFSILQYGEEGMVKILPIVSLFFLSLYRMLPSIVRIVGILQDLAYMKSVPKRIYEELNYSIENLKNNSIEFGNEIEIKNLTFEYQNGKNILDGLSLKINKGESIAFIGESGSGKTTLVDILIGLYKPKFGEVYIDNEKLDNKNIREWRKKIGYIPQEIYLFDGTVAENIAFNSSIDEDKIISVLKKAKIWEFLKEKEGIYTKVGDAGIMLSGGQKQRIGIARALYSDPEILVLDEATSALDDKTEKDIIDELYDLSKDKTLIMIAHRLTSLKKCNKIYEIEKGKLKKEYSTYEEVINAKRNTSIVLS